ncbi:signal peptidase II [Desulfurobacterium pacificum]|uniref:Lipoprotein signal peptidase n=1 Tax=Desulfurobacterium pacificum TaxID=240166 RepID=A0ABY1N926_9BACT|nr:signal peptidase II [Desulfurobacterium pacificum]SMP03047.1 signal peptidase II [Desulfurobacterium pacificum]
MKKLFFLIAFLVFVLDRITKLLAVKFLVKSVSIIPGFFSLTLAENRGAAFSIFSSGNQIVRFFFLIILPVAVIGWIVFYVLKRENLSLLEVVSLSLITGGALGNLFDRVLNGRVVDFIDFHIGVYHYPTFNVADVAVFLGCLLLLYKYMKS